MSQSIQIKPNDPKELFIDNTQNYLKCHSEAIRSVCVDKKNLYVASCDCKFSQTPLDDLKREKTILYSIHSERIPQIRKRKKENLLVTCSYDRKVLITNPKTNQKVKEFIGNNSPVNQTLDYQKRLYSFGLTKEVLCWDFETKQLIKRIETQDNHSCATFDEESGKIFAGATYGNVTVIDPESNKVVKVFRAHNCCINEIISKDGIVYTAGSLLINGSIKSWSTADYRQLKTYEGHYNGTTMIKSKWRYLFSSGGDCQIKIWDLETTQLLYFVKINSQCRSFDLNKNYIYSASNKKIVLIKIGNELETYSPSKNHFLKFFKNQKFCDFKIFDYPVHKFLIRLRCLTESQKLQKSQKSQKSQKQLEELKKIFENNFSKEETFKFLEWVYGKKNTFCFKRQIQKITTKLGIQSEDLKKKTIQYDLIRAYSDENSKDFSIIVKYKVDPENDDEEKEKEKKEKEKEKEKCEEIKVHKFILLARCGLFRAFFEYTKEKKPKKVQDYSGKSIQSIKHFIKYLYFNDLELTIDDDPQLICDDLEDAQDYYQLDKNCKLPFCLKKIKKQFNLI
ncbi:u5 small nuclear ribonucleoprotein 40 kda protein [Anaeramoeba flamelloides]|uniref:U5 small nuclear ribonucleoprotein 40 kDa protein n=1 Tax=Anaeramoeba flamelloides TaxID=1746091 RepID=A0ABQ8ZAI5_9EUKA|nr:u5 small nuclear ribonucleoprotein 40 kda protein [Anaeramoeba flamelloides]